MELERTEPIPEAAPLAVWAPEQKISATDGTTRDLFGYAVALSGDTAVIGAPYKKGDGGTYRGAAFVFTRAGTRWTQAIKFADRRGIPDDLFGYSVATDGHTIVVGNPRRNSVYLFTGGGTNWSLQRMMAAHDTRPEDAFGTSVALSGDRLLVGAPGRRVGSNDCQGAAHLFERTGTTWKELAELTSSGGRRNDSLGTSVALDDSTAIVGAPRRQGATEGAAYVFERTGAGWPERQELDAGVSHGSGFGWRLAASGGALFVTFQDNATNAVHVFVQSGATWIRQAVLTAGAQGISGGGTCLAAAEGILVVGSTTHQVVPNSPQGGAYVYVPNGASWKLQEVVTAKDGAGPVWHEGEPYVPGDCFGWAVALSGRRMLVGAFGHRVGANVSQGAAYFFSS